MTRPRMPFARIALMFALLLAYMAAMNATAAVLLGFGPTVRGW